MGEAVRGEAEGRGWSGKVCEAVRGRGSEGEAKRRGCKCGRL